MPVWHFVSRAAPGEALRRGAGLPAGPVVDFNQALQRLDRDEAGVWVVAVAGPEDVPDTLRLVQVAQLRRSPIEIILLETGAERLASLEPLDAYVAEHYHLATDRAAWQSRLAAVTPSPAPAQAVSLVERIRQRLAAWTPSLLPQAERLALAAEHDVTVLITGETGTGKTHLARLLHDFSSRAQEKLLVVACGALSGNLVESEFFGHVKGAFTGADRAKAGKFAAVGSGTLLLDEIDALPLEHQANLLRVVETGEFEPVGSNETLRAQCRLIVASNRDLAEEAAQGRFRQDLYYRFNVMRFHLPPVRERAIDLVKLIRGLTVRYALKFNKPLFEIAAETQAMLVAYSWPGNIRELENALQSAVLVSSGETLQPQHLPQFLRDAVGTDIPRTPAAAEDRTETLMQTREQFERAVILRALSNHANSRSEAARELGISRVTLYKKMKKYEIFRSPTAMAS
jgi:DNA-binding NtrC family response regulator